MEKNLIEKYDRARYRLTFCMTLGFIIAVVLDVVLKFSGGDGRIRYDDLLTQIVLVILVVLALILIILAIYGTVLNRRIKKDKVLRQAFEREMNMYNDLKSYKLGFQVMSVCIFVAIVLADTTNLGASSLMWFALMTGIIAYSISWLIYNR